MVLWSKVHNRRTIAYEISHGYPGTTQILKVNIPGFCFDRDDVETPPFFATVDNVKQSTPRKMRY